LTLKLVDIWSCELPAWDVVKSSREDAAGNEGGHLLGDPMSHLLFVLPGLLAVLIATKV
jgi:hypothetical protein